MSTQALRAAATGSSTSLATGGKSPPARLQAFLEQYKAQFATALPKHLNADRMIRLAMTSFNQNRALQECDMASIAGSIVMASQLGLEIGVSGQGYLVPYKKKCQFIPGWQGIVDLISRSGRATVWTGAVFDGDEFDYAMGDSPFVKHRPCGEDNPEKMTHVYAVGRVNGSQWPVIEVWPIRRVWKHRDKNNKVGQSHYSYGNPEMYARKIPLLQVAKYMPKSIELSNALAADAAYETGNTYSIIGDTVFVDTDEGPRQVGDDRQMTVAEALSGIEQADNVDALDSAYDMLGLVANASPEDRKAVTEAYNTRRAQIEMEG